MEELFRSLLLADAGVSAIAGTRINYTTHPQGAPLPGLVLSVVSDAEEYTLEGTTGVSVARIQVDCYGTTYADAKQLSRAVRSLLSGYMGAPFQGVFHIGSRDGREGGTNEAERPYRVSMDFIVHYST